MPEFAIFLHPIPGAPPFDRQLVQEHCRHLGSLAEAGQFLVAGPFGDDKGGGMYGAVFDSEEAASCFAAADPFVLGGFETVEVRPWTPVRPESGFLEMIPPLAGTYPGFLEGLRLRSTTYRFSGKPIDQVLARELLEAALTAPSEFNLQPWRPVVCRSVSELARLEGCCCNQKQVSAAAMAVICAVDPAIFLDEAPRAADDLIAAGRWAASERESRIAFIRSCYGDTLTASIRNGAIFGHQLLLAAFSKGLQGFWLGGFDLQALRREFRLPERVQVAGIVGLGWSAERSKPNSRLPAGELIGYGTWNGRP